MLDAISSELLESADYPLSSRMSKELNDWSETIGFGSRAKDDQIREEVDAFNAQSSDEWSTEAGQAAGTRGGASFQS